MGKVQRLVERRRVQENSKRGATLLKDNGVRAYKVTSTKEVEDIVLSLLKDKEA